MKCSHPGKLVCQPCFVPILPEYHRWSCLLLSFFYSDSIFFFCISHGSILSMSFGGTLEVLSYRGGWFLYGVVGVCVPVAPIYSDPPQFHKNGEVCGVVIKSCHWPWMSTMPRQLECQQRFRYSRKHRLFRLFADIGCWWNWNATSLTGTWVTLR